MKFHVKSRTYQFTAISFGLVTAPVEFIKVVKKVKLLSQARGIRIHQYLDWTGCSEPCVRKLAYNVPDPLGPVLRSGWVVNITSWN